LTRVETGLFFYLHELFMVFLPTTKSGKMGITRELAVVDLLHRHASKPGQACFGRLFPRINFAAAATFSALPIKLLLPKNKKYHRVGGIVAVLLISSRHIPANK
jgi:hypothetical protein